MSQIRKGVQLTALLFLIVLSVVGCGSSNPASSFDPDSGRHPGGWLPAGHKGEALSSLDSCASCHGADYAGGIAKVSCTSCHLGDQKTVHPLQWGPFANLLHANYVRANGDASCANGSCHGVELKGAAGPSCTLCHLGGAGAKHPVFWGAFAYASHSGYVKANGTAGCANASCHGPSLAGVAGSGPSCAACHIGGANSKHPTAWTADMRLHKAYVAANGDSSCRNAACHGPALQGVSLSGPACQACHK